MTAKQLQAQLRRERAEREQRLPTALPPVVDYSETEGQHNAPLVSGCFRSWEPPEGESR